MINKKVEANLIPILFHEEPHFIKLLSPCVVYIIAENCFYIENQLGPVSADYFKSIQEL